MILPFSSPLIIRSDVSDGVGELVDLRSQPKRLMGI
jgi:hypothetical protein